MNSNQLGICALLGLGVIAAIYYATSQTDGNSAPIPSVQGEAQVMGMNVPAGQAVRSNQMPNCTGTMLDMDPKIHFWDPGVNAPGLNETIKTPHRYPAIPGGNLSTVMHKGWSCFNDSAPADNDWRLNPPEVAVL